MHNLFTRIPASLALLAAAATATAQVPVSFGAGSIASAPPSYKAKTTPSGPGFNATAMLSRKIFAEELQASIEGALEVPGRPIPTNDWWTDIINNRFSGSLWSYPAMLRTSEEGVEINFPSYWADAGKELKCRSAITVSAAGYRAEAAVARDWHDWDVVFAMPDVDSSGEMVVTSAHGSPFTWFEFSGLTPELRFSDSPELFDSAKGRLGVKIGSDLYGVFFPQSSSVQLTPDGVLSFTDNTPWVVVGLLREVSELVSFDRYATSIPRDTRVDWVYDEPTAKVCTSWTVSAVNLRDKSSSAPVLQGFLPHAYKHALPGAGFGFIDQRGILTPRGQMLYGASDSGSFSYAYRFSGMIPAYGAPDAAIDPSFQSDVLSRLMADYVAKGAFGGDTYWGGKGLVQMALNMSFARQTGDDDLYEQSKARLRETLVDWLTYTPGEDNTFFCYYPRWGAMLGFDVSYDSDAFNDHHFHFGYFTYAAALLCMEDPDFATQYGPVLTLIAKDYANWDRSDSRFPFMRTLDPWCGHSWAGGLGDHGNDNGNGQESSSEAMQSWGGLYLLGVALGDREMRDAGIWGWNTEARATREYWYDVDAPRPANPGGRKPWPGKGDRIGNYNYDEYPYAYNSNITGKGIGWWTWFGGDPLYMHGIQWMPISPALDYLSWDPDFAAWALDDMLDGANSTFSHDWFKPTSNTVNGDPIDPLATNDWGNVALAYMQRFDPAGASAIFDEALSRGLHIATAVSTAHISYFIIHNHLTYGDPDFSVYADIPTAQMCVRDGVPTYFVYNPDPTDRTVHFYSSDGALLKTVTAPARRLAGISADPVASSITSDLSEAPILPPGSSTPISAYALDQYGARMADKKVSASLSAGAPAAISGQQIVINAEATKGTRFDLTLSCDKASDTITVTVNDSPVVSKCAIADLPEMCEVGTSLAPQLLISDQYGSEISADDVAWTLTDDIGNTRSLSFPTTISHAGAYTITATSASLDASSSARIVATPPLPLISEKAPAMASSAENGGTLPAGATDGDTNVRWGSAHTSDEWIVVDLGEDCYISRVAILWEAAYGSHYLLQTAPADAPMQTLSVSYAGSPHSVTVPADDAWVTASDVRCSSAGEKVSAVNASGRYLRMRGLERSSTYGYSIYELSVYGLRSSTPHDDIIGIDFELPATLNSGETITLSPAGFNRDGRKFSDVDVLWAADKVSGFSGNDFTPLSHGMYTLTASLSGKTSTSAQLFVNEMERPAGITFETDTITTVAGRRTVIPFTVMNQFLAPYTGSTDELRVSITDPDGHDCPTASFAPATGSFFTPDKGSYRLDFDGLGSCFVRAVDISEVNLALGKRATASSTNGNSKPSLAVDGNLNTRWESDWAQPQALSVDLGSECRIDRIRLVWENAYAKSYRLQASLDGETWRDFYSTSDSKGDTEEPLFDPLTTRYIRLCCDDRALPAYGFSLYELEAYGDDNKGTSDAPIIYPPVAPGQEYWYDLQGRRILPPTLPGIYVRLTSDGPIKISIHK